ncbi:BTB/POZ and MATH domain-containing protein 1-like [Panicum virgatum]|uniref:Uncharacterized protein n=1 Tax=Panicum virgatum TaxID=38727 RepID=A0A8T0PR95_PANVG|nr:BTB/POZ and MATH domain-containing protein 1-like [Panicum virgatum]KAG2563458.1 hypothetical protein PVAP13_8KG353300 [Panicum virgatum]
MKSASAIVAEAVTGSHVLNIEGYSRTKGLGGGEFIQSSTFDVGGHRWFIRYYPDGYGSDNAGWISFYLQLQHSDATSVKASLKLSLLDEMGEPVPSHCTNWGAIATLSTRQQWGCKRFIEKKTLEESAYLKDNCFAIRFDIIVSKEFRAEDTTQFVAVPPSDLHQHLGRLLSSGAESDVTFRVGGETFDAHRLVLAARSPVFTAELFGPMREERTTGRPIQIDDMEPGVFGAMLHYIYTDSLPEAADTGDAAVMAQHVLVAADRYGLERLKLICEDKLCSYISTDTAATTLALAEQHGCRGLKKACFSFLRSPGNLKAIIGSDGFQHLTSSCPSLLNELLANVAP